MFKAWVLGNGYKSEKAADIGVFLTGHVYLRGLNWQQHVLSAYPVLIVNCSGDP